MPAGHQASLDPKTGIFDLFVALCWDSFIILLIIVKINIDAISSESELSILIASIFLLKPTVLKSLPHRGYTRWFGMATAG